MPTRAMLLTAGLGERMLPLTAGIPKPSLPVLGRPLVVQLLRWLQGCEPQWVVLNLHHHGGDIQRLLGSGGDYGLPPIRYSHEQVLLGTGGGLRQAAPSLRDGEGLAVPDALIVSNGDFLSDIDLQAALAAHRRSGDLATLVLAPPRPGYAAVEVDAAGRVLSLNGHPASDPAQVAQRLLFTGCHIISPDLLDLIPERMPSDIVRDVYRDLAARRALGSVLHEGFWWEFGSPEQYLAGSLELIRRSADACRKITEHDVLYELDDAIAACGAGVHYHPGSRFRGRVALGFATEIGKDSVITDSMIMPEAWIGPGCRLTRCIVGRGAELPAGYEATAALICGVTSLDGDPLPPVRREGSLLVRPMVDLST